MTYTNATKDTYTPPACWRCGGPTDVDWIDVTPGPFPLPPDDPNIELVPGRATCSARCWEDGHTAPPCPRCGADGGINWPEISQLGDAEARIVRGSNYCTERCSKDLPSLERTVLRKQYPGWSW